MTRGSFYPNKEYSKTTGHIGLRLEGRDLRKTAGATFSQWIVHIGNMLPEKSMEADTIMTIKRYMNKKGLEGYRPHASKWN